MIHHLQYVVLIIASAFLNTNHPSSSFPTYLSPSMLNLFSLVKSILWFISLSTFFFSLFPYIHVFFLKNPHMNEIVWYLSLCD